MLNESQLKKMVRDIIGELLKEENEKLDSCVEENKNECVETIVEDDYIDDITEVCIKEELCVPNPANREGYMEMKQYCPARLGIWRTGPRHKTASTLRFWADHAAAQGAVFSEVDENIIDELGLLKVETMSKDKSEFLKIPPTGTKFSDEYKEIIKNNTMNNSKVQIVVGDGLSSSAITANIKDVLPSIEQGLKEYGIDFGKHIFVKNCRVEPMDTIAEITGTEVIVMLIGERPGLGTAESMSSYIAYKPTVGMQESRRTVISNIHKGGTPPVEGGARISELVKIMLKEKASGRSKIN